MECFSGILFNFFPCCFVLMSELQEIQEISPETANSPAENDHTDEIIDSQPDGITGKKT